MKHDFFISYSRMDSGFALQLVRDLRQRGLETWLDQLDIPPGVNWDSTIESALDQAKIVIVVLSAESAKSDNVKNEIGAALERGKQVVPVVLARGAVPLMINRLQREDFTGEYRAALEKLVHRLSGGSRTESLRAISSEDVARLAKHASARLGAQALPQPDAPGAKDALRSLISEQFFTLDRNGDGILTADELASSHPPPVPDSLAPASAARLKSQAPARVNRKLLVWGGPLLALAAVLMANVSMRGTGEAAPQAPPPLTSQGATSQLPPSPAPTAVAPSPRSGAMTPAEAASAPEAAFPRPAALPTRTPAVAPHARASTQTTPAPRAYGSKNPRGAWLCTDSEFKGSCQSVTLSTDLGLMNDLVSSVALGTCRAVRVCSDVAFGGVCQTFRKDQPDLSSTRVGTGRASSIECFVKQAGAAAAATDVTAAAAQLDPYRSERSAPDYGPAP
jgi:hypothetical protein